MAAALARRNRACQQAACQGKEFMHAWEQSLALLTSTIAHRYETSNADGMAAAQSCSCTA